MERARLSVLLGLVGFLTLFGCSKESSTTSSTSLEVSGSAVLGPVDAGAVVNVYGPAADGTPDRAKLLGSGTVSASSVFRISLTEIPSTDTVRFLAIRGPFTFTEFDGTPRTVASGQEILIVVPVKANATAIVANITDATLIATARYLSTVTAGVSFYQTAINALYAIGEAIGMSDVLGTIPAPLGSVANDASGTYAIVLVALGQLAQQAGVDTLALARGFATQFGSAGSFVGGGPVAVTKVDGSPVTLTPSFTGWSALVGQIIAGTLTVPNLTVPPALAPPIFVTTPSEAPPAGYNPGAPPPPPTGGGSCVKQGTNCFSGGDYLTCCPGLECRSTGTYSYSCQK